MADLFAVPVLVALLPLIGAVAAAVLPGARTGAWLAVAGSMLALALSGSLPAQVSRPGADDWLLADALSSHIGLLVAFMAAAAAWAGRAAALRPRPHAALFLALLGFLLTAALANNLGLVWIGMEAAMLAAAAAMALSGTAAALAAARRLLLLGGAGLLLALFGTILLYLAVQPVLGPGAAALRWTALADAAPHASAPLLSLAFVFLLLGYGAQAGLVPLHAWLAGAGAEAPVALGALLGGAMPCVALAILLRVRGLLASNEAALAPGPPLMALGLATLLLASLSLGRRRDAGRLLGDLAIGQSGLIAFAFGLGGLAATFAGLLQLTLHALARSAVLQVLAQGGDGMDRFGAAASPFPGRGATLPALTLAAGLAALAGLPPFGLFASGFLIAIETMHFQPWLALPLGLGLVLSGWGLARRLTGIPFPLPPRPGRAAARAAVPGWVALLPAWLPLALTVGLGLAMPGAVLAWLAEVAGTAR
jgi:hydrogenase-4 component F